MNIPTTIFTQEQMDLLVKGGMMEQVAPDIYALTGQGSFFFGAWLRFIITPQPQPLTPLDQVVNPPIDDSDES